MILPIPGVLVDASVWIDHLRSSSARLVDLLTTRRVLLHPFVIGELACGSLRSRDQIINHLLSFPQASTARDEEAMQLLENHNLYGRGLSWVDVHLLASASISRCLLWSTDKALASAADRLGLSRF